MVSLTGSRRARVVGVMVALSLLSGCGEDAGPAGGAGASKPEEASASFPVTISAANGDVTIEERPEQIVSLSATATEILFAIGAGDQVVAVDDQSNYPAEAPMTDLSGFDVNIEAVAGYEPDLVVYSTDPGGLQKSLDKLSITAVSQVAAVSIDDTYAQIEQLGDATGHPADADALIEEMQDEISDITSSVPDLEETPTYYHELDTNYFTVTSETFIGEVYSMLGLENIADAADKDKTGYPQLSAEYILDANPDLVFLADTKCCDQNSETVERRPGWEQIDAVRNDDVVELDDDIASRWGPRVVDFLRTAAQALESLESAAA